MGVFSVFDLRRTGSFSKEGNSWLGRRLGGEGPFLSGQDEPSYGKDSSTSSAVFDLELSHRGKGGGDLLARLNPSVLAIDDGSTHARGDLSVRLPSGLLPRIIYLSRPVMEFEVDLLQDLRALCSTAQRQPDGQLDLSSLVVQLQDLGYACYLKRNNPADPAHRHNVQASCLEKLRHEFIMCAGRADGSLAHWCLVEPRFRDQFAIAQPTPAYDRCLKAVPLEFVGTPLRLYALVETLSAEMAEAFASRQRTLPPWRKLKSMLSKWFDPEDMLGQQAAATAAPPSLPQVQVQAAAGLPLSPVEQVPVQGGGFAGLSVSGDGSGAANVSRQSQLQLQAAAALAERQTGGGGSQNFYQALAMHQESMRLQQQRAQQRWRRTSPPRQPLLPTSQRHQAAAAAALMPAVPFGMTAYLDAAWMVAAVPDGSVVRSAERSNKPRRRVNAAVHPQQLPGSSLWGPGAAAAAAVAGDGCAANRSEHGVGRPAADNLQASGSWSDLSTILETQSNSNSSSPAVAALLTATNFHLGTSGNSRQSQAGVAAAEGLPLAQLSATQQRSRPTSGAGSFEAEAQQQQQQQQDCRSPTGSSSGELLLQRPHSTSGTPLPLNASGKNNPGISNHGLGQADGGSSGASEQEVGGKKKAVSLLAKSLKSVNQKQTWQSLLLNISTVRRMGPSGAIPTQRSWSWRSKGS